MFQIQRFAAWSLDRARRGAQVRRSRKSRPRERTETVGAVGLFGSVSLFDDDGLFFGRKRLAFVV